MANLSKSQVAKRLEVSSITVTRWIRQGLFPNARKKNPYNPASHWIIPEEDVIRFQKGDAKPS